MESMASGSNRAEQACSRAVVLCVMARRRTRVPGHPWEDNLGMQSTSSLGLSCLCTPRAPGAQVIII
ncbi:hypothetical protein I79_024566 [Cricetulus griseus]|uniref:Uncharacterized protein n=1 Tax=Cricetulus griseus TaxID=10029 RepID=G3IL08_CRIGR|nr:hypothetical protein I79_024566 [Cricetulus griseus]